ALAKRGAASNPGGLLRAVREGLARVGAAAGPSGADDAASELTTVYLTDFEPLERYLFGRSPQSVRPLEMQFNTLRGDLSAGLKGPLLAARLDAISSEVEGLVSKLEARTVGAFGTAFIESLITIVREGVEIILVLAMLIALVSRTTTAAGASGRAGAMRAIWWGTGLAIAASALTAWALHFMVASTQGRVRETLEGLV